VDDKQNLEKIRELERQLADMRAQYQRLETRYDLIRKQLVSVLWCNGPQEIPKSSEMVPSRVRITERTHGAHARLSVTLLPRGVIA